MLICPAPKGLMSRLETAARLTIIPYEQRNPETS